MKGEFNMPKFDDYTQKSTPEDTDLMLLLDKTENANKKVLFSGIWNWIVKKLAEAVIEKLQTSDKTIIGALNELNSNISKIALGIGQNALKITLSQSNYSGGCILFAMRSNVCKTGVFAISVYRTNEDGVLYDLISLDNTSYSTTQEGDSVIISGRLITQYSEAICMIAGNPATLTITPFKLN